MKTLKSNPKNMRIDLRTNQAARSTIENAANFLGVPMSAFILQSAVERANQIITDANVIQLNNKELAHFLDILDTPPKANTNLKALFKKHGKK